MAVTNAQILAAIEKLGRKLDRINSKVQTNEVAIAILHNRLDTLIPNQGEHPHSRVLNVR